MQNCFCARTDHTNTEEPITLQPNTEETTGHNEKRKSKEDEESDSSVKAQS